MSPRSQDLSSPEANDIQDLTYSKRGCCFWIPCSSGSVWWQRITTADQCNNNSGTTGRGGNDGPWWTRGWKKIREWSELLAGPKWKTFIRRFNRNRPGGEFRRGKFHYDALSYAMNFDEGPGQHDLLDEDYMNRDFSSRYASLPVSTKGSMDLGNGKDSPYFYVTPAR